MVQPPHCFGITKHLKHKNNICATCHYNIIVLKQFIQLEYQNSKQDFKLEMMTLMIGATKNTEFQSTKAKPKRQKTKLLLEI